MMEPNFRLEREMVQQKGLDFWLEQRMVQPKEPLILKDSMMECVKELGNLSDRVRARTTEPDFLLDEKMAKLMVTDL